MKLLHFTAPDGIIVRINPEHVVRVRERATGEFPSKTNAVIDLVNGTTQAVNEHTETVEKMLAEYVS